MNNKRDMLHSRFAPTPSGFLHIGNLLNFILVWREVRKNNSGKIALRIDDLDITRVRDPYIDDIFEVLNVLGFDWDFGPKNKKEFIENYSQSKRTENYRTYLNALPVYACTCSRLDLQSRGANPYDGFCRNRKIPIHFRKVALRISLGDGHDPIIWRKEDLPSYHLVSVVEDFKSGVNLIIRGEDLRESSEIQKRLAKILNFESYSSITHKFHPLLLGQNGKKLSKSDNADSVRNLLKAGGVQNVWSELSAQVRAPEVITDLHQVLLQDFWRYLLKD